MIAVTQHGLEAWGIFVGLIVAMCLAGWLGWRSLGRAIREAQLDELWDDEPSDEEIAA